MDSSENQFPSDENPALENASDNVCKKLVSEFADASKENMKVFLRVRPFKEDELENEINRHCLAITDTETVLVRPPDDSNVSKNTKETARIHQRFNFSRIYGPEFDQKDFFETAVLPIVKDSLKGETCLIFAYGATNSGKSYTIQGVPSHPGIIPRTLAVIFKSLRSSSEYDPNTSRSEELASQAFYDGTLCTMQDYPETHHSQTVEGSSSQETFESSDMGIDQEQEKDLLSESVMEECNNISSVWVSFAEIYNENIYDLLQPLSARQKRRNLKLGIDRANDRGVLSNHIKGLRYICVNSVADACRIVQIGRKNLHFASTKLNQQSSRSHCIFGIHMIRSGSGGKPNVNSLTYCDLAGLERVTKTQNTGFRLKEAGNINTSLLVLGRCIEALREKRIVPYRDSKLTRLFQGYFTENGKATMIVNVSQSSEMFNDTLHVLKFSASAQQVVSIDNFDRSRLLWHDQSSSRLTDLWPMARQRWSEFSKGRLPNKSSIPEEESLKAVEESLLEKSSQVEDADAQELIDLVWEIEKENQELKRERDIFEAEIRSEVCGVFDEMMNEMEQRYKARLKKSENENEDLLNERFVLKSTINELRGQMRNEEEDSRFDTTEEVSNAEEAANEDNTSDDRTNMQERYFLKKERESLFDERQNLLKEKDALATDLNKMQQEANLLQRQQEELQKEKDAMFKEASLLQKENERLLKDSATSDREISTLKKEKDSLVADTVTLRREIAVLQKAYDSLLNEKPSPPQELKDKLQVAVEAKEKAEKEMNRLEEELATIRKTFVSELKKKQKRWEDEHLTLAASHDTLKRDYEDLKKSHDSLNEGLSHLKERRKDSSEAHKRETLQLEKNIAVVQLRCDKLEGENAKLREEKATFKNEVRLLKEKVATLEMKVKIVEEDDFKDTKKPTRGRKRAAAGAENVVPKKSPRIEDGQPSEGAVAIRSPLAALSTAIRQSPTYKAVEKAVGRVVNRFANAVSSPAVPRRTRRKLYAPEEPKDTVAPAASEVAVRRNTRRKN